MTLGSLFDGSGGFPLAGSMYGIIPVWCSEVEPYPIAVTKSRFPDMIHLGDVSKLTGAEIAPVDIITFGSPCQDLSVAGKRSGLKHESNGDEETTRSGLFMEAIRIIKEMREATNGRYPTFALWENVPGAFSSNGGEDFRIVLQELIKIVEPEAEMPPPDKNRWSYADSYVGDGWSIAYRTLDAQYWGVPQRRRRIYLVADFRGERATEILFKREGLRGYFEKGRTPWKAASSYAERSIGSDDRYEPQYLTDGTNSTIVAKGPSAVCYSVDQGGGKSACNVTKEDTCYTLNTIDRHAVYYATDIGFFNTIEDKSPTLLARGYKDPHLVTYQETPVQYIVRRITPTECARLQGFPDTWGHPDKKDDFTDDEYSFWMNVRNTHASINGKQEKYYGKDQMLKWYNNLHTDSAEYKMWGNGIALPTALYVMHGIAETKNTNNFEN